MLLAACASDADKPSADRLNSADGTLEALWKRPGEDVGLMLGTSDFAPGRNRVSFLVVAGNGKAIERPRARVWIARARNARPYARATARLEPMGAPGREIDAPVSRIYVAHVRVPSVGRHWMLAEPVGGKRIQALGTIVVKRRPSTPALGQRAIPSRTPTLRSARGNLAALTTASPPDRALLRYSVAESLAARVPFVLAFATPKHCASRTCGPTVDVVDAVRRELEPTDVRFIHVEIYRDNDPDKGVNRWVKEWKLPSEPWVFVVGRDGRIKAKFEGAVSVRELRGAVRRVA